MVKFKLQHARDLDLSPLDRALNVRRERKHLDSVVQPVVTAACGAWLTLAHRIQVKGMAHLPKSPPYVMVANHTSHLDTPAMRHALPADARRRAFTLAAHDTFFKSYVHAAAATTLLNALPVRRGRADPHALQLLRQRIIEDELVLVLYPEGTRNKGERIKPFLPGIGMLVAGLDVPVMPCRLRGCERALPKGRWCPRPARISLVIGEPVAFERRPQGKDTWRAIARELHDAVCRL